MEVKISSATNAASKETKSQVIDRNQRPKYIHAPTAHLLANSSCQHGITHPPLPNPENKSTYRGLSDTDNYIKRRYILPLLNYLSAHILVLEVHSHHYTQVFRLSPCHVRQIVQSATLSPPAAAEVGRLGVCQRVSIRVCVGTIREDR